MNLNLSNSASPSSKVINIVARQCTDTYSYLKPKIVTSLALLKINLKARMLRFSISSYLLSCPTCTAYFSRQLCGPLLPPAQECISLQCISFYSPSCPVSPSISAHLSPGVLPHPQDSVSRCPHLKSEYPSPDIARAFWTPSKRTHRLHVSVPTELGFALLSPRGMPTLGQRLSSRKPDLATSVP